MDARRELFARYCRFGERLNIGSVARLRPTQFTKFCKDAGFVVPTEGVLGHFKAVDCDIVFKCLVAQQVMSEQAAKEKRKDVEAALKVATNGVDSYSQGTKS